MLLFLFSFRFILIQIPILEVAVLEGKMFLLSLAPLFIIKVNVGSLETKIKE